MQDQQLEQLRQRLEEERAALRDQEGTFSISTPDQTDNFGIDNHPADDAEMVFIRERNLALLTNAQDRIQQIEEALQRMDEGTYGTCENCGRPIGNERLEALPFTTRCVACQAQAEQTDGR